MFEGETRQALRLGHVKIQVLQSTWGQMQLAEDRCRGKVHRWASAHSHIWVPKVSGGVNKCSRLATGLVMML